MSDPAYEKIEQLKLKYGADIYEFIRKVIINDVPPNGEIYNLNIERENMMIDSVRDVVRIIEGEHIDDVEVTVDSDYTTYFEPFNFDGFEADVRLISAFDDTSGPSVDMTYPDSRTALSMNNLIPDLENIIISPDELFERYRIERFYIYITSSAEFEDIKRLMAQRGYECDFIESFDDILWVAVSIVLGG